MKQAIKNSGIDFNGKLSLAMVLVFAVSVLATVIFSTTQDNSNVREGEIALRTVYAQYDFEYPWGINQEKTEDAREAIRKTSPFIFEIDNSPQENAVRNLALFFENIDSIKTISSAKEKKEALDAKREISNIDVPDKIILYFADIKNKKDIEGKLIDVIASIYPIGIIDSTLKKELFADERNIKIQNQKIGIERIREAKDIFTQEDAERVAKEYIARIFPRDSRLQGYGFDLISKLISPNMEFKREDTERLKEEAVQNTPPVYNTVQVKKNELILNRGERITKRHIAELTQVGAVGGISNKGPYLGGMALLLAILITAASLYLFLTEKKIIASPSKIAVILINSFIIVFIGQLIIQAPQSNYIIPLSGCGILIALLVNANIAFVCTLVLSIFLSMAANGKIEMLLALFVSAFTAIYVVRDARRRSRIILAGIVSGMAGFIMIIAMGLLNNLDFKVFVQEAAWGLGGGIISIFVVMGLLPLFEYAFKVTTNITLLEMSDLNHPLLKELTLKAPGTYQHSVVVGNLAEAACEAIGANSLLARVGSYYHDIGKIGKAEYFSENEMGARSKHEKLTPSMSALIIVNHVKDGVDLAKKYKLNSRIIDFVAQHHGTGLIYYFYQRALEKVKDDEILKEEEFRYPGPKPQTKEVAVVLLADSVEASSRALSDPTPARIRSLVQKIINNKFIDDQLDECDLTLKDLNKIALSFVRVLTAVFHARLEYPDKKNNGAKKNSSKPKSRKSK